jgi:hypothetical protein
LCGEESLFTFDVERSHSSHLKSLFNFVVESFHSSHLLWRGVTLHIICVTHHMRCGEESLFIFAVEESLFTFDMEMSLDVEGSPSP